MTTRPQSDDARVTSPQRRISRTAMVTSMSHVSPPADLPDQRSSVSVASTREWSTDGLSAVQRECRVDEAVIA